MKVKDIVWSVIGIIFTVALMILGIFFDDWFLNHRHIDEDSNNVCDVCVQYIGDLETSADLRTSFDIEDAIIITLTNDVIESSEEENAKLILTSDKIVDFSDKTLKLDLPNASSTTANWVGVNVNGGEIVFDGTTGGIKTADNGELYAVVIRNGATLTINGGSYIGGTTAISVTNGTLIINGGFFDVQTDDDRYVINCIDAAYRSGDAVVEIKGGTFVNFDPSNNAAEGQGTNFVAEGYTVISEIQEDGDMWYTVVAE